MQHLQKCALLHNVLFKQTGNYEVLMLSLSVLSASVCIDVFTPLWQS